MNVITLKQPWAMAVCYLGKRIENRTWAPAAKHIGQPLAIHAGVGWDEEGAEWIWENFGVRYIHHDVPKGYIVATTVLDAVVEKNHSVWFSGPLGWCLSNVRVLDVAIPAKGRLGLWTHPVPERPQPKDGGTP